MGSCPKQNQSEGSGLLLNRSRERRQRKTSAIWYITVFSLFNQQDNVGMAPLHAMRHDRQDVEGAILLRLFTRYS